MQVLIQLWIASVETRHLQLFGHIVSSIQCQKMLKAYTKSFSRNNRNSPPWIVATFLSNGA